MKELSPPPRYKRHRFPLEILAHAVWLSCRVARNFREGDERLAARGVGVTYATLRPWCHQIRDEPFAT